MSVQERERDWSILLAGRRRLDVGEGLELRLLSAMEVLEARREAGELAQEGRERALCSNACLLARALERDGAPVFQSGRAALEGLRVGDIGELARRWAQFSREEDPSPEDGEEAEKLKKAWSTRLMRAFSGVCSGRSGPFPPRRGPGR